MIRARLPVLFRFLPGLLAALAGTAGAAAAASPTALPPPAPPTLTPASCGIEISWAAVDGATSYDLYYSPTGDCSFPYPLAVDLATTSWIHSPLPQGTVVSYYLVARGPAGNSPAGGCSTGTAGAGFPLEPPGAPALLPGCLGIAVSWPTDPCSGRHEIWRATGGDCDTATLAGSSWSGAFFDTNVALGETYAYRLRTTDGVGWSEFGNCSTTTWNGELTPPAAPSISQLCDDFQLSWGPVACANTYGLQRSPGPDCAEPAVLTITAATTFTDTNVAAGETWSYRVRAGNGVDWTEWGACSSRTVDAVPAPLPPVASSECAGVGLSWPAVQCASSYQILRAPVDDCDLAITIGSIWTTSYTDTTAEPGVPYAYRIRAIQGGSFSNPSACTIGQRRTLDSPNTPLVDPSCSNIRVSWANVGCATSYEVQRTSSGDCDDATVLATTNSSYFIDTSTLEVGTTYHYRIRATNGFTWTGPGACASATAESMEALSAPTFSAACGFVRLYWDYVGCSATYEVSRGTGSSCEAAEVIGTTSSVSFDDHGPFVDGESYTYRVRAWDGSEWTPDGACATWTYQPNGSPPPPIPTTTCSGVSLSWGVVPCANLYEIDRFDEPNCSTPASWSTTTTSLSVTDSGIVDGATPSYQLRARNGATWSKPSACVPWTFDTGPIPGAPTVTSECDGFEIAWTPVACASGYQVLRQVGSACAQTTPVQSWVSQARYRDPTVLGGETYSYSIRAYLSGWTEPGPCTTATYQFAAPAPPTAPSLVSGCREIQVTIPPFACANRHRILRSTGTDCAGAVEIGTGYSYSNNSTLFYDDDVTPGQTYSYRTQAGLGANWTDVGGCSTHTFTHDLEAPSIPSASQICYGVQLDWPEVPCANSYDVYRTAATSCGEETKIGSSWYSAYTDQQAPVGSTYSYRVRAISSFTTSAPGECLTTPVDGLIPTPPAPPSFQQLCGGLKLTWGYASCARSYEVRRSTSPDCSSPVLIATVPATSPLTFTDAVAPFGELHWYTLRAVNPTGSSADSPCTPAPAAGSPPPPASVVAESDCGKVRLSWQPVDCATSYDILRTESWLCSSTTSLANVAGTSFEDLPPVTGTTLAYQVRARNAAGPSTSGPCDSVFVPSPSGAPAAPPAAVLCGAVSLDWPDPFCASRWTVERSSGSGCGTPIAIGTTESSAYLDHPPSPGTWSYRLVRTLPVQTGPGSCTTVQVGTVPDPPAPPTLTALGCSRIGVSWSTAGGFQSFDLERSLLGSCTGGVRIATGLSSAQFVDDELPAGSVASYRVVGRCGPVASFGACATLATPTALPAPTTPTAKSLGCERTTLSWAPVTGASFYRVAIDPGGACSGTSPGLVVATNRLSLDGLAPGSPFSATVVAFDGAGCSSPASPCATFTPPALPPPPAPVVDACGAPRISWSPDPAVASWVVGRSSGASCPPGRLREPNGIVAEPSGALLVADRGNATIRRLAADRSLTTIAGSPGLRGQVDAVGATARFLDPTALALDATGQATIYDGCTLRRLDTDGAVTSLVGQDGDCRSADGSIAAGRLAAGQGIALSAGGDVWFAESSTSTIRRLTAGGLLETVAGSAGIAGPEDGVGAAARFSGPRGIATEATGSLIVADTGNHTLRRVEPDGQVTTLAGAAGVAGFVDGPAADARFSSPTSLSRDPDGNLWIADTGNGAIRRLTPAGVVETPFRAPTVVATVDDAPSPAAKAFLAADGDGGVWLADSASHTILRWNPGSGLVSRGGISGSAGADDGAGFDLLGSTTGTSLIDETVGAGSWSYVVIPRDACGLRSPGGCAGLVVVDDLPARVGDSFFLVEAATELLASWTGIAGAGSYELRSDSSPSGLFGTVDATSAGSQPSALAPIPSGDRYYRVFVRESCAEGQPRRGR